MTGLKATELKVPGPRTQGLVATDPTVPGLATRADSGGGGGGTPYDDLFRQVFGIPRHARPLLRRLAPEARDADMAGLARAPRSFFDLAGNERHADLVFTAPIKNSALIIYFHLEHQSTVDNEMPFRILFYQNMIWTAHARAHPGQPVPRISSALVYHNRERRRWRRRQLADWLDPPLPSDPDSTRTALYEYTFEDLTGVDEDFLRALDFTPAGKVTWVLLTLVPGNQDVVGLLRRWAGELRALLDEPDGHALFDDMLEYIGAVSDGNLSELSDFASSLGTDAREVYMTIAERLEARGCRIGLLEALKDFGELPPKVARDVDEADLDQLRIWNGRVRRANTLNDIFR